MTEKQIIKVRLLLRKEGKILMLQKSAIKRGTYSLVGGTVEQLEAAKDALIREAKEEANIQLDKGLLELVHVIHHHKRGQSIITLIFETDWWKGKIKNLEPKRHQRFVWTSLQKIPAETVGHIKYALANYRKGIRYSEFNWKPAEKK